MAKVVLQNVVKHYGEVMALDRLDLTVREGEFLSLLGPSGCGKTTALRLIAGFLRPSGGRIFMDCEDMTAVPPERRNIGMVFQDYALFPHLTVAENVAFGLVERRRSSAEIADRVGKMLDLVQLRGLGDRYPSAISGGQQQRVAMARALAVAPRILLMDEPLGALDLKLREAMQDELHRLQRELGITTVYVTHDQGEAIRMSHRIAVMNAGKLMQLGTPNEIYNRPSNHFVARFVGRVNFVTAEVTALVSDEIMEASVCGQRCLVRAAPGFGPGTRITLALRPEALRLGDAPSDASHRNVLVGRVTARIFAGSHIDVVVELGNGETLVVEAQQDTPAAMHETIRIGFGVTAATIFNHEEQARK